MRKSERESIRKAAFDLLRTAYDRMKSAVECDDVPDGVYIINDDESVCITRLEAMETAVRAMLKAAGFSDDDIAGVIYEAERTGEVMEKVEKILGED